jgi:hypothetical protein
MAEKTVPVRGSLLVNRRFQFRMLATANLVALAAIGLIGAATYVFLNKLEAKALLSGLEQAHPLMVFLRERQRGLFALIGFVAVGTCMIVSLGTLVLSHRIAGPIYRLQKELEGVAEGRDPGKVGFRPRDFFPELASAYNGAVAALLGRRARKSGADDRDNGRKIA